MLERSGHTVEMANDGLTAVQVSADSRFDLILMDINMPGMDGTEATRIIRDRKAFGDMPIIGITANVLPQDLARYALAGLTCTLIKPITAAALELHVREITKPNYRPHPCPAERPLIALDTFHDLQAAMLPQALMTVTRAAFDDAAAAIAKASIKPTHLSTADQLHHAAGSAAFIGAQRLHLYLCDLENAVRTDQSGPGGSLLERAAETRQHTDDWFAAAICKMDRV